MRYMICTEQCTYFELEMKIEFKTANGRKP